MKIGLFVGSFNPPHLGHKEIANKLINDNYVDKVYFIPTFNYWHKTDLIDIKHRVNMLKFYESNNIKVKETDKEYTYQILKDYDNPYLIIGSDNLENFHKWKNIDEILKHNIIVINRDNVKTTNNFIYVSDFNNNISSTLIRNKILSNESIKYLVGNKIEEYINKNNLYGRNYV